jgi:hypothetical protein
VESSNVLPSLLHKGDQEVDGHGQVLPDVVLTGLDGSNGGTEAGSLLGLELDSVLELINLGSDLLTLSESDREETHLDQHVSEQLGGLLGNGIAGQKDVVLLGPLLDLVLVLVKGLETVNVNEGDAVSSGLLDVGGVGEDADLGHR